jgi:hypothetical protein
MKTDKELADELDAKKRLQDHGYRQSNCPNSKCFQLGNMCPQCGGKGYIWENTEMLLARIGRTVKRANEECVRWDKAMERWNKSGVFSP